MSYSIYGKRIIIVDDGDDSLFNCKKCCFNDNQYCGKPDYPLCLDEYGETNRHFEEVKVK